MLLILVIKLYNKGALQGSRKQWGGKNPHFLKSVARAPLRRCGLQSLRVPRRPARRLHIWVGISLEMLASISVFQSLKWHGFALICIPSKSPPETIIPIQIVYVASVLGKLGGEGSETGKGKKPIKDALIISFLFNWDKISILWNSSFGCVQFSVF